MPSQQPGDEQIQQLLNSSFTGLDDKRTENLKRTHMMQINKDSAIKKEQARLLKKYGAGHPRVAKIINRIDYNRAALPEVKTEIDRSQIKIPQFDTNTWMVHGRVLNQKFTGIKGLTLAMCDSNGRVEKQLGYACTDERGYYAIRYHIKEDKKAPFDETSDYFLNLTDKKGKICHKEEKPLHVVLGRADYRPIILDEVKCTPPPGWKKGGDDKKADNSETGES